jgi:hypothetical protein
MGFKRGLPMGFRVQLIAITGKEPGAIQRDFGVVPTGQREEIPESRVVGAVLPNGAYLLHVNDSAKSDDFDEKILPGDELFARVSKGASLIACYVNETVMCSYTRAWADGVLRWSVYHSPDLGAKHLETSGSLPAEMQPIRDRLYSQQDEEGDGGTDYVFDIPVELFVASGGIRYDEDIPGADPEPWEVLDVQERPRRRLWPWPRT